MLAKHSRVVMDIMPPSAGTMPSRDQDQESDMSMSLPAGHYSQEGSSSLPGTPQYARYL